MDKSSVPDAMTVLKKALVKDKSEGTSYYYTWQSTIAGAFYDECERFCKANKKKAIHPGAFAEVGNNAAKKFLDLLIS